jgi:hypothetical protein
MFFTLGFRGEADRAITLSRVKTFSRELPRKIHSSISRNVIYPVEI